MRFDPIAAIEACWAPVEDDRDWLAGVGEALSPLDRGLGRWGATYDASDPEAFRRSPLLTLDGAPAREVVEAAERRFGAFASPDVVRAMFWNPPPVGSIWSALRRLPAAVVAPLRESYAAIGVPDAVRVFGADPEHRGAYVGILAERGWKPHPRTAHLLRCVAAHLSWAVRLRRTAGGPPGPDSAGTEAILSPSGRIAEVRGPARDRGAAERIAAAVRRIERVRSRASRVSAEEAVHAWQGLVDGTWSVIDHLESAGRRYVLAVRNVAAVRDPKALTAGERDVLALAAMGRPNKSIGDALGLAPSTVADHLARAQRKLRLRSRVELIRAYGTGVLRAQPEAGDGAAAPGNGAQDGRASAAQADAAPGSGLKGGDRSREEHDGAASSRSTGRNASLLWTLDLLDFFDVLEGVDVVYSCLIELI